MLNGVLDDLGAARTPAVLALTATRTAGHPALFSGPVPVRVARMTSISRIGAVLCALFLAVPAVAGAATKSVDMGIPHAQGKQFEKQESDVNAFFPTTVTVRVGQPVRFVPPDSTTSTSRRGAATRRRCSAVGQRPSPAPTTRGQPVLVQRPARPAVHGLADAGPLRQVGDYDGTKRVNSGLPLGDKLKAVTVTFKKTGTVTYYCDVHPA